MGTRNAEERRKAAGKHRKESFSVKGTRGGCKIRAAGNCGRAGSARRGVQGASCPLQRVDNERKQKSKRSKQSAVRHLENKILQANCNLRNIHKQFGQRNSGEQHKGKEQSDFAEPNAVGFSKSNFS